MSDEIPSPPEDEEDLPVSFGRTVGCFALIAAFFVAVGLCLWYLLH